MSNQQPPRMAPYGRHVLICTGGSCAAPEIAQQIERRLADKAREHGRRALSNPERIKCTPTGCLGVCQGGPILVVYPEGIWYHHVDDQVLDEIVERHLLGGVPVGDRAFHRLYPPEQEPSYPPCVRGDQGQWSQLSSPATTALVSLSPPPGSPPPTLADLEVQAAEDYRHEILRANRRKGLVLVNTGNGKGKTTAAIGLLLRAWGRDMRVGVVQFIKSGKATYGESMAAKRLSVDWITTGDGWTWTSKDMDETEARARHGWELAREKIVSGSCDVLVLDEFTYPLHYGWLDTGEVIAWLATNKPPGMHLVITGRHAPPALMEFADLVTEMREVKHPFQEQGIRAQPGVEY